MRSLSKRAPFSRVVLMLLFASGAVASCRLGYEEVEAALGAGSSGDAGEGSAGTPSVAGSVTDGGKSSTGGSSLIMGGEDPGASGTATLGGEGGTNSGGSDMGGSAGSSGGGSDMGGSSGSSGGGSDMGGSAGSGGMGGSGSSGSGGMGGEGGAPPCTSTAACTCDEFGGHSYWFCTSELTWTASETQCESVGMQLVRIDSQAENDFLETQGFTHGVFTLNGFAQIGINSRAVDGEWRWVDGTLAWQGSTGGMAVNGAYTSWFTASPSGNSTKVCAGILVLGDWQDRSCTAAVPSICESP